MRGDGRARVNGRAGSRGGDMRSTAYPGQEWTPAGIEQGNYEWE